MIRTLVKHLQPARPPQPLASASTRSIASHSHSPAPAPAPAQQREHARTRQRPSAPTPTPTPTPARAHDAAPSHYLVTLLRSTIKLGSDAQATARALGLSKRLSSSIVPVNAVNAGYILRLKEIVGVRLVGRDDVEHWASAAWRERPGDGRKGSGLSVAANAGPNAIIRVGSERARGDERGFRVVGRASPL